MYIYIYIDIHIYIYMYICEFKAQYNNHKNSFTYCINEKSNRIFKYICNVKDKDKNFTIKWSIAGTARPYTCGTG